MSKKNVLFLSAVALFLLFLVFHFYGDSRREERRGASEISYLLGENVIPEGDYCTIFASSNSFEPSYLFSTDVSFTSKSPPFNRWSSIKEMGSTWHGEYTLFVSRLERFGICTDGMNKNNVYLYYERDGNFLPYLYAFWSAEEEKTYLMVIYF